MLKRAYIEITNICNLACSFCPGTRRKPRVMTAREFRVLAQRLQGHVGYLYLHVMGEPLLHPQLSEILAIAGELGFKVCITTNGALLERRRPYTDPQGAPDSSLPEERGTNSFASSSSGSPVVEERGAELLAAPALHKVSISLHSMEGNGAGELGAYLQACWDFARRAAERGVICALRLWNVGGEDRRNGEILAFLESKLGEHPLARPQPRSGSWRLAAGLYLEQAERFDWPDLNAPERDTRFCLGLREQVAVLVDGTVVPCCLDHEGDVPLGNLFDRELDEILSGDRAKALYDGFSRGRPSEELCRRCGFATRFH